MIERWLVVLGALCAGCVQSNAVTCRDGRICPADYTCDDARDACVSPAQTAACDGKAELDPCSYPGVADGACFSGVCLPAGCGNGVLEPLEACDDGNDLHGDGCSADCLSVEVCGNGVVDEEIGEACDNALLGLSRDGCSSTCTNEADIWRDVTPRVPRARIHSGGGYAPGPNGLGLIVFGGSDSTDVSLDDTLLWPGSAWTTLKPPVRPPPRFGAAITFDTFRRRLFVFGGRSADDSLADTWEFDGVSWTQHMPATFPPPRAFARAAYDSVRKRIVMFGGESSSTKLGDTWEWDGANWVQLSPATKPTPRSRYGLAFDAGRSVVVLYGGEMIQARSSQTWEWNGTTWTASAEGPVALNDTALAYDSIRQCVVMFGGRSANDTATALMWERCQTVSTWSSRTPAISPPARSGHVLVFDSDRNRIVAYGGQATAFGALFDDLWEWDANVDTWTQRKPVLSPSPREYARMAYDPVRGRVVLFGGTENDGSPDGEQGDTWEWDGRQWLERLPETIPPPRKKHAMAYDRARRRIVMFGGRDSGTGGGGRLGDTWEWDGTTWTDRTPTGGSPSPRGSPLMAFDDARGKLLLYGGNSTLGDETDTWEWDGVTWTERTATSNPGTVTGDPDEKTTTQGLAYDPVRSRIVLFASNAGGTWEWDGTNWLEVGTTVRPSTLRDHGIAFDAARGRVVLFGGRASFDSDVTWEWDGTNWEQRAPAIAPTGRSAHAMAYDAQRGQTLVFGGSGPLGDTWAYGFFSAAVPPEACELAGSDTDADAFAACADPDCWARCTPLCPPRTTCDMTLPRCGDGACGAIEDRYLCPSDCM